MGNYPDIYILGRQVNGVYVEYSEELECYGYSAMEKAERLNKGMGSSEVLGEWKVLKYGTPETVEAGE